MKDERLAQKVAISYKQKKAYYEEAPCVTPRVQAALDKAAEEFHPGETYGKWEIIGKMPFLRGDGRIYFRAQDTSSKKRKTEWLSLFRLRQIRARSV